MTEGRDGRQDMWVFQVQDLEGRKVENTQARGLLYTVLLATAPTAACAFQAFTAQPQ